MKPTTTHTYNLRSRNKAAAAAAAAPTPDADRMRMAALDAQLEACKPHFPPVSLLEKSLEAVEAYLAARTSRT